MFTTIAVVAALSTCLGIYLNDVLSRRRTTLKREGLLGESFDFDEAAGGLISDPRLARFGMLRMVSNGIGLLFCAISALLLYRAIFTTISVDAVFWASWAGASGISALFFWAGR